MKKILLLLFSALPLIGQTTVQKGAGNALSNGPIVVGNGNSITATGTGVIAATSVPGITINTTAPLTGGGALSGNLTFAMPAAGTSTNGYLTSTDWNNFNTGAGVTYAIPLSKTSNVVSIALASDSVNGYLSSTDWTTFNAKQAAGSYITALTGDGTAAGPGSSVFTLSTVNSNVGTFAGITVDAKGRVTGATALTTLAGYGITDGVNATSNDTNVTGSVSGHTLTLGWAGTLAAGRLNSSVVQSVVNDINVTGSVATQTLTLGWTGQLSVARGGTGAATLTGVLLGNGTSAFTAATLTNLTLSGGTLSISSSYPGQASIVTVGTLTSGAIGSGFTAIPNSALANSTVTIGSTSLSLGSASTTLAGVTSIAGLATITGGAGNMTIVAGTGNSRTMALQTTTSGGTATTFLTGGADQSVTFAGIATGNSTTDAVAGGSGYSVGSLGGIYAAKKIISASAVFDGVTAAITGINSVTSAASANLTLTGNAGASLTLGQGTSGLATLSRNLNIGTNSPIDSNNSGLKIIKAHTGTVNTDEIRIESTIAGNDDAKWAGFDVQAIMTGAGTYNHMAGHQDRNVFAGSGTLTEMWGSLSWPAITSSGNVTNRRGFYIKDVAVSSTGRPVNNYGIYAEPLLNGTTSNYLIYSEGAGKLRFGDTTASTTYSDGSATFAGGVGIAGTLNVGTNIAALGTGSFVGSIIVSNGSNPYLKISKTTSTAQSWWLGSGLDGTNALSIYDETGTTFAVKIAPTTRAVSILSTTIATGTTSGSLINAGGFGNAGAMFGGSTLSLGTNATSNAIEVATSVVASGLRIINSAVGGPYLILDSSNATLGNRFNGMFLRSNGADSWQFGMRGDANSKIRDSVNGVDMVTFNAGAVGAGFISFANTLEATTGGVAAATIAGGLYVAKKVITASSVTTGAPTTGSAAAWKLGDVVTGVALTASATNGLRVNIGGTDYTLAILTTNP